MKEANASFQKAEDALKAAEKNPNKDKTEYEDAEKIRKDLKEQKEKVEEDYDQLEQDAGTMKLNAEDACKTVLINLARGREIDKEIAALLVKQNSLRRKGDTLANQQPAPVAPLPTQQDTSPVATQQGITDLLTRPSPGPTPGGGGGGGGGGQPPVAKPSEPKQLPWSDYFAGLEDTKGPLFKEFKTIWKDSKCKIGLQNLGTTGEDVGENVLLWLPGYARGHRWEHHRCPLFKHSTCLFYVDIRIDMTSPSILTMLLQACSKFG